MASRLNRTLTDHEEIRQWAEERGARPACVMGTGTNSEPGMLRLDFPGFTGEKKLREISWDEWFRSFDQNSLALIVQDRTASGKKSNFNKLIARRGVEAAEPKSEHSRAVKTPTSSRTTPRTRPPKSARRA